MKVTNDLAYFSMEIITTIESGPRTHTYKTFTGLNKPTFSEIDKHFSLPGANVIKLFTAVSYDFS